MSQPAKLEWNPCPLCGEPNGAIVGSSHMTPSRFNAETIQQYMTPEELERWRKSGKDPIDSKCRSRLYMRKRRAGRVAKGLPADAKRTTEWKP